MTAEKPLSPSDLSAKALDAAFRAVPQHVAQWLPRRTVRMILFAYERARHQPNMTAGTDPHPDTAALIDRFATELKTKLARAEAKYGYGTGWKDPANVDAMREALHEHIAKGDPRDVANYCAFLWHHEAATATPQEVAP